MKFRVFIGLIIFTVLAVLGVEQCKSPENKPVVVEKNEYTGSASCESCHRQEHKEWMGSHHYKAMLPASDSTVEGDFNNATLNADGVHSLFFRRDGKFFINTEGDDGKNHDYEVKYTFGYTPLQQYLIEFPDGRMQATRVSWDTQKKRWFHQYAGQKIPSGDWLHWTGNGQNWNTMCASCHSTNVQKGYDTQSDKYKTTFNEVNVSCESCHGPGKEHIDYIKGTDYTAGKKIKGSLLHLSKESGQLLQVNTCGYCHARRSDITGSVLPGKEFLDDIIPELPTNTFFFADGQMKEEDFNYTSFLQSKMFHHGVECSNCHSPHSGKLKLEGNVLCGLCHGASTYNVPAHTMHAENSTGSFCVNCHMPSRVYMGVDLRHDHSFRIPRPDLTVKYGVPNTCNSCHQNKTAAWAEEAIRKNYGGNSKYHFAEDLVPGSKLDAGSEPHLNKLLEDTATPDIVRAAVVDYISRLETNRVPAILIAHLQDSSADIRFRSLKGLMNEDPALWINAAAPLLLDPVRAVRIAAAELFTTIPANQVPNTYYTAFNSSKAELETYIVYQTDFAEGNVQAADYFRRLNDPGAAEKYYRRALAKDNQLTIARVNLASTLNASGKNEEALQQLLAAQKTEPKSDHIYYTLALLYVEMKETAQAVKAFQKGISLGTRNIRVFYNYGLLLQQSGRNAEVENIFLQALKIEPENGDILYALTVFYIQQKNNAKATETALKLKQFHGDDPNYRQLLQQMRL